MRTAFKNTVAALMLSMLVNFTYAQFFRLGGNVDIAGANGLLSNSNFFGATGNTSVRLGTGGISRIFIGGNSYAFPGFIGIGTSAPQSFTHIHNPATGLFASNFTQWTNTGTTAGANRGLMVGNVGALALVNN